MFSTLYVLNNNTIWDSFVGKLYTCEYLPQQHPKGVLCWGQNKKSYFISPIETKMSNFSFVHVKTAFLTTSLFVEKTPIVTDSGLIHLNGSSVVPSTTV